MRFEAYLRVLSDEVTIRTLYTAVSLKGATITQLKAPNPGTDQFWWNWKTTRVVIDGYDVDAKVRALLEQYRPYFPDIKKLAGDQSDIYLELVSYHDDNELPVGFCLSAESVFLLNELGASIDYDPTPGLMVVDLANDQGPTTNDVFPET